MNRSKAKLQNFINNENISKSLREQGTNFEKLSKKILQIEPSFSHELKEVYLWSEFATKFNIDGRDIGIDLMALDTNDDLNLKILLKINKKR